MATNKALALAACSVAQDFVDIVELEQAYPFDANIWAACGKDADCLALFANLSG